MRKKMFLFIIITSFVFCSALPVGAGWCLDDSSLHYNIGVRYYQIEDYDKALDNFYLALEENPSHAEASRYIDRIQKIRAEKSQNIENVLSEAEGSYASNREYDPIAKHYSSSSDVPSGPLGQVQVEAKNIKDTDPVAEAYSKTNLEREQTPKLKISGEARLAVGFTPTGPIWKKANEDKSGEPQQKNWRYFSGDDRYNTYDEKIYDRLQLDIETQGESPLSGYMQLKIDPWAFIAQNDVKVIQNNPAAGFDQDFADIEVKYWSIEHRTLSEVYRSNAGNIINVPEAKVLDGTTGWFTPTGLSDWGVTFDGVAPYAINREIRPVRKLWFEYAKDDFAVRAFPLAGEEQALTSDDPLRLSNNHIWWEESPWLYNYEPSRLFYRRPSAFATIRDPLKRGIWRSDLARVSQDSDAQHLTYLRGVSLAVPLGANGSVESTIATPLSLWADYEHSDSIFSATRTKYDFNDDLQMGFTYTNKMGLAEGSVEAVNNVFGVDVNYDLTSVRSAYGEFAVSDYEVNEAKEELDYSEIGTAFMLGLREGNILETKEGGASWNAYVASMDSRFEPGLSNYRNTRRDQLYSQHLKFEELDPQDSAFRLGDGIDAGRQVVGLRWRGVTPEEKFDTLVDVRRIRTQGGKYVETDSRLETTWRTNDKLTTKFLGYYQDLPKTTGDLDPHIYAKNSHAYSDAAIQEDRFLRNVAIEDGKEASIGSFGLGAEYELTEKIAIQGIYERTNDPGEMPRILLTDSYVEEFIEDGYWVDNVVPFLYDQTMFDLPPYKYYGIYKGKLKLKPKDWLDCVISYTKNDNEYATGIDDNVTHVGVEFKVTHSDKFTYWIKYIASSLTDFSLQQRLGEYDKMAWHHNVFLGLQYNIDDLSTLDFLYGEFVGYDDEYIDGKWSLSTLDTRHIFRIFYTRKF